MTLIKGILLPIRAEYLVRILNGEKTQELRDSLPKDFKEGWVYLYCTKAKPYLLDFGDNEYPYKNGGFELSNIIDDNIIKHGADILNGKVVARFWFDESTKLLPNTPKLHDYFDSKLELEREEIWKRLCLNCYDIGNYGKGKILYAWHIKQLEIFDKPKELKDFYVLRHELVDDVFSTPPYYWCDVKHTLTKAPQSWRYVYTKEKE